VLVSYIRIDWFKPKLPANLRTENKNGVVRCSRAQWLDQTSCFIALVEDVPDCEM
jgi:hypothetical protein